MRPKGKEGVEGCGGRSDLRIKSDGLTALNIHRGLVLALVALEPDVGLPFPLEVALFSGDAIGLDAITSSIVIGAFICEFECSAACRRVTTGTCASCSRLMPYSCI